LPPEPESNGFGQAVSEVSERATLIIREEIELAKTEISEKVTSLLKGAVVGIAAGIFIVIGLLFLLIGASYVFVDYIFDQVSFGFFIVAGALFVLGGLAGFLAARAFRSGAPPTPEMAIDEAKKIRETVQAKGTEVRT
jgi:uncharacterized membrane protein YqjE